MDPGKIPAKFIYENHGSWNSATSGDLRRLLATSGAGTDVTERWANPSQPALGAKMTFVAQPHTPSKKDSARSQVHVRHDLRLTCIEKFPAPGCGNSDPHILWGIQSSWEFSVRSPFDLSGISPARTRGVSEYRWPLYLYLSSNLLLKVALFTRV